MRKIFLEREITDFLGSVGASLELLSLKDLKTIQRTLNSINKLYEEEAVGGAIQTTASVQPHEGRLKSVVKRKRNKRKRKPMKESFSIIEIKDRKLTRDEYEGLKSTRLLVPVDEENIEYKLLNVDSNGNISENTIMVNRFAKMVYIEANNKETINHLLSESNRSYNKMIYPEMRNIYSFVKSLANGYDYVTMHDDKIYNIKF